MNKFLALLMITQFISSATDVDKRCAARVNRQCELCWDGYVQGLNCQAPNDDDRVDNCMKYVKSNELVVCEACEFGFYKNQSNQCVGIHIEGCQQLNENFECVMCEEGIKVQNGQCYPEDSDEEETRCQEQNCEYCQVQDRKEVCVQCDEEHSILYDSSQKSITVCMKNDGNLDNCKYRNKANECVICQYGYYITSEGCKESNEYNTSVIQVLTIALTILFLQ